MMEDWTDIIGESLRESEETLPADDWSVLQQKYASARKRKRIIAMAWASAVMSVAAACALLLFIVREKPETLVSEDIVAEAIVTEDFDVESIVSEKKYAEEIYAETVHPAEDLVSDVDSSKEEQFINVIPDENNPVADIPSGESADRIVEEDGEKEDDNQSIADDSTGPDTNFIFEDELPGRHRRPITVGLSASVSGIPEADIKSDMANYPEDGVMSGNDSLAMPKRSPSAMKKQKSYTDEFSHQMPVSVGLSLRFGITDRLSINTGVNYTRYASTRNRSYIGKPHIQPERQYVHYIGIPVRLDWIAVNRKLFNLYLGAGFTMDKCVFASVGGERLYEKQVLFGLNATAGIQVNLAPKAALFLEPEFSYNINKGTIETYRYEHPLMLSARAGLRLNL